MLTEPRPTYQPFEYPEAHDYFMRQQQAHWLHTEISMGSDVDDWQMRLTDNERTLVGNVLKGFTQAEVVVGDYWGQRVPRWFPKAEVQSMGATFAAFEAIHAAAYAHLNTTLGLDDFEAFLYEPAASAKIGAFLSVPNSPAPRDILRSLGTYSAFVEGVSLFSSFAILMSFAQRNLLKGVGQIVSWSVRDESLHSTAGCWLYRTYAKEVGAGSEARRDMLEAAHTVCSLEHAFIDMCFAGREVEGITAYDVRNMISHRTNTKLADLSYHDAPFEVDHEALKRMRWFDLASAGVQRQDFFAMRPTNYSKAHVDWAGAF